MRSVKAWRISFAQSSLRVQLSRSVWPAVVSHRRRRQSIPSWRILRPGHPHSNHPDALSSIRLIDGRSGSPGGIASLGCRSWTRRSSITPSYAPLSSQSVEVRIWCDRIRCRRTLEELRLAKLAHPACLSGNCVVPTGPSKARTVHTYRAGVPGRQRHFCKI